MLTENGNQNSYSIQEFLLLCDTCPNKKLNTTELTTKFGFHRRRFYDLVNVLNACECCKKIDSNFIIWKGVKNVELFVQKIIKKNNVLDSNATLRDIIPIDTNYSIDKITEYFFLYFMALQLQYINIKEFGLFITQGDKTFKTVLCKLYHITHILEAVGIIKKTENPGESYLCDNYFVPISVSIDDELTEVSLCNLLNRENPYFLSETVKKRRKEYNDEVELMNNVDRKPV